MLRRFEQNIDTGPSRRFAGKPDQIAKGGQRARPVIGDGARHQVHATRAGSVRIRHRCHNRRTKFVLAFGKGRDAALSPGQISRRQVEKRECKLVGRKPAGDLVGFVFMGKRYSTAWKPASAAAEKRSRKDHSLNIHDRLAVNLGMISWRTVSAPRLGESGYSVPDIRIRFEPKNSLALTRSGQSKPSVNPSYTS